MNASEFRPLHAATDPANAEPDLDSGADPTAFLATLRRIQSGAAADGQPWPERSAAPGRRMALADADCALAGLRVVQEMLLAGERARQNGEPAQHLGDRTMEGLMLACVALTAQASACLQVHG